jgi:hypothetical protein
MAALTAILFIMRSIPNFTIFLPYEGEVTPIPFYSCHPVWQDRARWSPPTLQIHSELCAPLSDEISRMLINPTTARGPYRPYVPLPPEAVLVSSLFSSVANCGYTFAALGFAISAATLVYEPTWKRAARLPQLQTSDWIARFSITVTPFNYRNRIWCVFPDGARVRMVYIPSVTGICEVPHNTKVYIDRRYASPKAVPVLLTGSLGKETSVCVMVERQQEESSAMLYPFKLVAVTMMHRSQHLVREWVIHHLLLGFQHILVYHDISAYDGRRDLTFRALWPFIHEGWVSYVPFERYHRFSERQFLALAHFQHHFANMTEWIIELDDDFYVVPMDGHGQPVASVLPFLDHWQTEEEVRVLWNLFGSSNRLHPPEYMTLGYFWRSNTSGMSFIRPIDGVELYSFQAFTKTSSLLYPFSTHNWTRRALPPQQRISFSSLLPSPSSSPNGVIHTNASVSSLPSYSLSPFLPSLVFSHSNSLPLDNESRIFLKPPHIVSKLNMTVSHYYVRSLEEWLLRNETAWVTPLFDLQHSREDAQKLWHLANRGLDTVFDDRLTFYEQSLLGCINNLTELKRLLNSKSSR